MTKTIVFYVSFQGICYHGKIPYTIVATIRDGTVGDLIDDETVGCYWYVGSNGQLRGLGG